MGSASYEIVILFTGSAAGVNGASTAERAGTLQSHAVSHATAAHNHSSLSPLAEEFPSLSPYSKRAIAEVAAEQSGYSADGFNTYTPSIGENTSPAAVPVPPRSEDKREKRPKSAPAMPKGAH
jgi:hypothetical protein